MHIEGDLFQCVSSNSVIWTHKGTNEKSFMNKTKKMISRQKKKQWFSNKAKII
jgi:hypothetical protein